MKLQSLRQIFKITEYRDGCVWKTKPVGYAWLTFDSVPVQDGNLQFHSLSTELSRRLGHKSIRSVPDSEFDMVITTLEEINKL